jgi:hypothetical protein
MAAQALQWHADAAPNPMPVSSIPDLQQALTQQTQAAADALAPAGSSYSHGPPATTCQQRSHDQQVQGQWRSGLQHQVPGGWGQHTCSKGAAHMAVVGWVPDCLQLWCHVWDSCWCTGSAWQLCALHGPSAGTCEYTWQLPGCVGRGWAGTVLREAAERWCAHDAGACDAWCAAMLQATCVCCPVPRLNPSRMLAEA